MTGSCVAKGRSIALQDGFSLGRQTADVITDEFLHLALTLEEKVAANPREFVGPALGHCERKHLYWPGW
jgi:hypothetical protein